MRFYRALIITLFVTATSYADNLDLILQGIEEFEGDHDPKCYATASRLEDFMYGTPLADDARFQKNRLQQNLAEFVWRLAGNSAENEISAAQIESAFSGIIRTEQTGDGDYRLNFPSGNSISISATDVRQYGSVAYSLRAILAVQQDSMMDPESEMLVPLDQAAMNLLKEKLDLATLALLKEADTYARAHDEFEIDKQNLNRSWLALFKVGGTESEQRTEEVSLSQTVPPVLKKIIRQKINSYAQYNQITNQLFVRNMQVYFARLSWPKDEQEAEAFRQALIESLIGYAIELYRGVTREAVRNGHPLINESDVAAFVSRFTPYEVNAYEDVEFFPGLPAQYRVTLEAYDLDAFRDSGLHWLYLGHALDSGELEGFLDVNPFAAELLVENVAQFGVLLLRVTGQIGEAQGLQRLSVDLLAQGLEEVQKRVNLASRYSDEADTTVLVLDSADEGRDTPPQPADSWFIEMGDLAGLAVMHRSSDWLNRLLRSYLRRDETSGTITIPPAFGGSGVAAEDINNDGLVDILLLSGLGNRLFLNAGDGRFQDITEQSGIAYIRPGDKQPGEPRQPLIADIDNDGWQDIVISYVNDQHRVYRNRGDATFEDVTARAGLGGDGLVGGPATIFDYNNDGLLDIYITYFGDYIHGVLPTLKRRNQNGLPNKLFKNLGDFRFQEVKAGVEDSGWGQAVTHTDLNGDNLQDLIVGNDFGSNVYYLNNGDGSFQDITAELGTGKPSYTMNISLADLNGDLIPDIYISNIVTMNKDEKYVLPNEDTAMKFDLEKLAGLRVLEANDLFISSKSDTGLPTYTLNRELVGRGYNSTGWSWGADFFDADNDGDDDLYVLNGMNEYNLYSSENAYANAGLETTGTAYVPVATRESNVFFINSNGKLNNVSEQSGLALLGNSRSAVYLDYDNDGDLDIVVNNYHEKSRFYVNQAQRLGGNWIKLKLEGDPAQGVNRDAIGAKVVLTLPDGKTIWREIHGSTAYMSAQPKVVHAGLGPFKTVDVRITWPDGQVLDVRNLSANASYKITMNKESAGLDGS